MTDRILWALTKTAWITAVAAFGMAWHDMHSAGERGGDDDAD